MIISLIRSFALLLGLITAFHIQASPFDPLIGTWKVVDERTGSYVSDIVIRRNSKTEQYSAVIVKMYPSAKEVAPTTCTKCTGALKDQPIVGMEVLTKLKNSIKMRNLVKVSGSTLMMVINTVFKDV